MYESRMGMALMSAYNDAEIEVAFRILRRASLIVKHSKPNEHEEVIMQWQPEQSMHLITQY